jgi:hypothetical protein
MLNTRRMKERKSNGMSRKVRMNKKNVIYCAKVSVSFFNF